MKSILLIILVLLFSFSYVFTQNSNDYIFTIKNDAIPCNIKKVKVRTVICYQNNKKVKYKAKHIIGFKKGEVSFDAGKYKLFTLGKKRWIFFRKVIDGRLNLYAFGTAWVDNTNEKYPTTHASTVYHIRRSNNPRGDFIKLGVNWKNTLKKTCSDCPEFIEKNDTEGYWEFNFHKRIQFYNDNCKN